MLHLVATHLHNTHTTRGPRQRWEKSVSAALGAGRVSEG